MKRLALPILVVAALVLLAAGGHWRTWSYGLHCTKCLASGRVVEERFLGAVVLRRTRIDPAPKDHERIFGRPCRHVMVTVGFGREGHALFHASIIACGMTFAGIVTAPRLDAVEATYEVERRLGDTALAIQTLAFVDTCIAPDAAIRSPAEETWRRSASTLHELAHRLRRATTVDDWRAALRAGRAGAVVPPH